MHEARILFVAEGKGSPLGSTQDVSVARVDSGGGAIVTPSAVKVRRTSMAEAASGTSMKAAVSRPFQSGTPPRLSIIHAGMCLAVKTIP